MKYLKQWIDQWIQSHMSTRPRTNDDQYDPLKMDSIWHCTSLDIGQEKERKYESKSKSKLGTNIKRNKRNGQGKGGQRVLGLFFLFFLLFGWPRWDTADTVFTFLPNSDVCCRKHHITTHTVICTHTHTHNERNELENLSTTNNKIVYIDLQGLSIRQQQQQQQQQDKVCLLCRQTSSFEQEIKKSVGEKVRNQLWNDEGQRLDQMVFKSVRFVMQSVCHLVDNHTFSHLPRWNEVGAFGPV